MSLRGMLIVTMLLAVLLPLRALAAPHAETLDPSGDFFIQDRPPQAFRDVDHIRIDREPLVGEVGFTWSGGLTVKRGARQVHLPFARIQVSGINLRFVTRTVNGVHYVFAGRFLRVGRYATMQPPGVVLTGALSRVRSGGQDVATLKFTYFVGE